MEKNPERTEQHPLSEKHTDTDDKKLETVTAMVTDPKFPLPALDEKSTNTRYVKSFATLLVLLCIGIGFFWFSGTELLQIGHPLLVCGGLLVVVLFALLLTETIWIDWYELVLGYWWVAMPLGALAGLFVLLNQEAGATMAETD